MTLSSGEAGSGGLALAEEPQAPGDLVAAARLHPAIDPLRVVDDLADRRIEAEEAVGHAQRFQRVLERSHAPDQVRSAPPDHHVERSRPPLAEMLAQGVAHRTEGGVDVSIVRLS